MIKTLWTRKATALTVAILAVAGIAVTAGLIRPKAFTSVVLNDQWRCTTTVCTKKPG